MIALFWFLHASWLYSRRTHPTLKKPGVQNLAAYENEGKQCKPRMKKKTTTENDAKKTKRLTKMQVLTKDFT